MRLRAQVTDELRKLQKVKYTSLVVSLLGAFLVHQGLVQSSYFLYRDLDSIISPVKTNETNQ